MSKERKVMVGAEIPDHLNQYLLLFAEKLGTSKSEVMRQALTDWVVRDQPHRDDLIYNITEQLQQKWDRTRFKLNDNKVDEGFEKFKDGHSDRLKSRGLNKEHVKQIIKNVSK